MLYIRECLDSGSDFDIVGLLLESEQQNSTSQTTDTTPESVVVIEPPNDLSLKSKQVTPQISSDSIHVELDPKPKPMKITNSKGRTISIQSMAEILLLFLNSLSDSVIPSYLYQKCITEGYLTFPSAKQIVKSLPVINYNVFVYITSFLKEIISGYMGPSIINADTLGELFYLLFFI